MAARRSLDLRIFLLVCVVVASVTLLLYHSADQESPAASIATTPDVVAAMRPRPDLATPISKHRVLTTGTGQVPKLTHGTVGLATRTASQLSRPHPNSLRDPHSPWTSEACLSFVGDTFHQSFKVCEAVQSRSSQELLPTINSALTCYKTSGNVKMGTCIVDGLALNCDAIAKAMPECKDCDIPQSGALWLSNRSNNETKLTCFADGLNQLKSSTEDDDFVRVYVDRLTTSVNNPRYNVQHCNNYVMGRTHMFMLVDAYNVYFNVLAHYNTFKSILDFSGSSDLSHTNDTTLRLSSHARPTPIDNDTEHKLFPNFKPITEYSGNTCFQQAVLVPREFSAVPFRCKMDASAKKACQQCNGENIESSFVLFKRHVLNTCNLDSEKNTTAGTRKNLVFVSRKPYIRFEGDNHSMFQRVLANADDLIRALNEAFPNTDINVVHLEEYSFCEQVKLAHNADVYMGVHGAGLVHLWWMRSEAVVIELEPHFTEGNPTFSTLSKLLGQRYDKVRVGGTNTKVTVNVEAVVTKVKSITSLA